MTRRRMMREMTAAEFQEWFILHTQFSPIGVEREDLRMGLVFAPIINLLRQRWCEHPTLVKPSDFVLDLEAERVARSTQQSMEDMKVVCRALAGVGAPGTKRKRKRKQR